MRKPIILDAYDNYAQEKARQDMLDDLKEKCYLCGKWDILEELHTEDDIIMGCRRCWHSRA